MPFRAGATGGLLFVSITAIACGPSVGESGNDGSVPGSGGMSGGGSGGAAGGTGGTPGGGSGGSPGGSGGAGVIPMSASSGCPLFTADDAWNQDISGKPVDAAWTSKLLALVGNIKLHPDFGTNFGIPINVVPETQAPIPVTFDAYASESDAGPYPFPAAAMAHLEGTSDPTKCDGDCHLLVVQKSSCMLYEGYACHYAGGWHCDNGARWDLKKKSLGQRRSGWTSADAAGLPIYAGLARYEEVKAGAITHAIRFTVKCSAPSFVSPATHQAVPGGCSAADPNAPPMGLRVRLKADFDITRFKPDAQVFLKAFKKYGMILADNGSNFFFQSEDSPDWTDDVQDLKNVPASAFEVVTP